MTSQGEDPDLLTVEQVAAKLQVAPKTIRKWVFRGTIPNTKLNGVVRFDRRILEKWIQAGSREESA